MPAALRRLSSLSFSGAGFLTIYHLGVAQCLLDHGLISLDPPPSNDNDKCPMILTGVSGGALVASALACGISPEKSAAVVLEVAQTARNNSLNIYHPGYSLIDVVEQGFLEKLKSSVHEDELQERTKGGTLRLGITDVRVFPPFGFNPKAYRYVDSFRSIEDMLAVCVLSSYVPGVTGPLLSSAASNPAVKRSQETLRELSKLRLVKDYYGQPIAPMEEDKVYPVFLDGGLVNVWPVVDDNTLIVTPLTARFENNNCICPSPGDSRFMPVNLQCSLALHTDNMSTLKDMVWSSVDEILHQRFAQGHDDAREFLEKNSSLLASVSIATTTVSS